MSSFASRTNPSFCMSFKKRELKYFLEMENKIMDETGKSRADVYKDALKHYWNTRQQQKLILV
tara:strand:+ start:380 stop:568 length:189 start_codon:yes stop_codon:yes gene_type:complete